MDLNFLIGETFRSNPAYGLFEWNQLNRSEQNALAGLSGEEDVFGVFRPLAEGSHLSYKIAYKEVALLFYFLQQPSGIPAYMRNTFDDDANNFLAKLVLDGILEIRSGNEFVCGAASQEIICKIKPTRKNNPVSQIAELSYNAINYALQLNDLDSQAIFTRLYCYNSIPTCDEKTYQLSHVKNVEDYLGVGRNSKLARTLEKNWYYQPPTGTFPWLNWRCNQLIKTDFESNPTFKIYISPQLDSFPEVFGKSLRVLNATKAFSFKTGSDLNGLLRPDKFVVYFGNYQDLMEAATKLISELKGFKAQGVPFTGQLDEDGLISWGMDPAGKEVLKNFEGGSWRSQVVGKIASVIVQAKSEQLTSTSALDFVINKISLEGIDPFNWTPKMEKTV